MRWTKLKSSLEALCAPTLRERVAPHQARYRYTREEIGRIWVTVDGREVASFDTSTYIRRASRGIEAFGGTCCQRCTVGRESCGAARATCVDSQLSESRLTSCSGERHGGCASIQLGPGRVLCVTLHHQKIHDAPRRSANFSAGG